jgi:tetratricopeptide (TPR) repeat protein
MPERENKRSVVRSLGELGAETFRAIPSLFRGKEGWNQVGERLRKRTSKLRKEIENTLPVGGVLPEDRKKAAQLTDRGRREYNVGLYDMAAGLFEKAVQLYPRYQKALYFLGNTYYKQKRMQEALAKWRACIDADPKSPIAGKARIKVQHVAKLGRQFEEQLRDLEDDFS